MSFMELQTRRGDWYEVDGNDGGAIIPADLVACSIGTGHVFERGKDGAFPGLSRALGPYYIGGADSIYSVELVRGWCARYSAPGYMDCTDWCGPYPTEREAVDECKRLFGEDEDDGANSDTDDTDTADTADAPSAPTLDDLLGQGRN